MTYTLRIVIATETDEPELLGTYVETEEDVVIYQDTDGRYRSVPCDCCLVRAVEAELPAMAVAV